MGNDNSSLKIKKKGRKTIYNPSSSLNSKIKKNYSQSYDDWEIIDENSLQNHCETKINQKDIKESNNSENIKHNNNELQNNQRISVKNAAQ